MNTSLPSRSSRPLVPSDISYAATIPRAAYLWVLRALNRGNPAELAAQVFPGDTVTLAAVSGARTDVPAWAGDLVQQSVAAWLAALGPPSAASQLIRRGLVLPLATYGSIRVPARSGAPTAPGWVAEGAPISARSYVLGGPTLEAKKFGCIAQLSIELARSSAARQVIESLLREDAGVGLDLAYFSDTAPSDAAHAGLLYNVPPLTSAGDMLGDMAALAAAVSAGGSGTVTFVAGPGRAALIGLQTGQITAEVLPSLAVAEDTIICLDASALVHGTTGEPQIDAAQETTIVMADPAMDIGTAGTPAVVGAPAYSDFQTGRISLRVLVDTAFGMRRSGAVAWTTGVAW